LKKLCAVMLFVFVATLFAASAAFATVRVSVDSTDIKLTGMNTDTVKVHHKGGGGILKDVSKDEMLADYPAGARLVSGDPTSTLSFTSSDHDWLVSYMAVTGVGGTHAGLYYDVPATLTNILTGGNGNVRGRANWDQRGFTVSPDHTVNIVNNLSANPALSGVASEDAVARVYMWSADITASGLNNVAVPVPLNYGDVESMNYSGTYNGEQVTTVPARVSNRFVGMNVADIKVVKVYGDYVSGKQIFLERVNTAAELVHGKFVITRLGRNASTGLLTETIVTSGTIQADTAYRIIYVVTDDTPNFDFTRAGSSPGKVVDPIIIYAEKPFVKMPVFAAGQGTLLPTVERLYAWRVETLNGPAVEAGNRMPILGYDDVVMNNSQPVFGRSAVRNDFTALVRDIMAANANNRMVWVTDATITDKYGFQLANVHKFPAALAYTTVTQNTAVVMFPIRDLTAFVGRTPADVEVVNATGIDAEFAAPQKYTRVSSLTNLINGTFAVLKPAGTTFTTKHTQVFVPADEQFVADGTYFIALAAKDGGDFDVQQGTQGIGTKNDRIVHFSAFAVVAGATPTPTPTPTPSSSSGGGCSVGGFAPATLLLLAPLFLLLKK